METGANLMFQIFEIGDNNMKVEFLSYSGLIVSALLCFFNKEVQVDFVRNACGLPFAIAIIVNILDLLHQGALSRRWQQSSSLQLTVNLIFNHVILQI